MTNDFTPLSSLRRHSVQEFPSLDGAAPGYFLISVASFADTILPWGQSPRQRDIQLREFSITEPWLASTISSLSARNAAFSYSLKGGERTIREVYRMLNQADFGKGWEHFIAKISIDLYSQDNGAFIEIIRDGDSPSAPVLGIAHLDAARCTRTGIPAYPVIYTDRQGDRHKLSWYQVVDITDNPSPVETMNGMQVCAVSRVLRYAQTMRDIAVMEHEKVSGRFTGALHLVSGVSTNMIQDALKVADEEADNRGRSRYQLPVIMGTLDPTAEVKVATLPLKALPENWSSEVDKRYYIAALALAFDCEYQDLAPLPGGNLGTAQQSQVLHLKASGKGPKLFMKILEHVLNWHVLPRNTTFQFTDADLQIDAAHAEVRKRNAETLQIYASTGALTPEVLRQMMVDEGILPREYLRMMQAQDVTPETGGEESAQRLLEGRGRSNTNTGGNTQPGIVDVLRVKAEDVKELTDRDYFGLQRQRLIDEYQEEMVKVLEDMQERVHARLRKGEESGHNL